MEQTTQPAPREQRPRRRWGDRRDGVWLRDLDALHGFTPYLFPNRADNEAFIEAQIDLTNIEAYLERKNAGEPAHRYTIFHVIAAAAVKCFVLRPRMNRFIQGSRMYQRNVLTLSFVVEKQFNDESARGAGLPLLRRGYDHRHAARGDREGDHGVSRRPDGQLHRRHGYAAQAPALGADHRHPPAAPAGLLRPRAGVPRQDGPELRVDLPVQPRLDQAQRGLPSPDQLGDDVVLRRDRRAAHGAAWWMRRGTSRCGRCSTSG